MHKWGDETFDWQGLNDAGEYIGVIITTYGRIRVSQIKEKFGTLRVYCGLGVDSIWGLVNPWFSWAPCWWPLDLDYKITGILSPIFDLIIVPWQKRIYRKAYKQAIDRWPHLREEILYSADYEELLRGL